MLVDTLHTMHAAEAEMCMVKLQGHMLHSASRNKMQTHHQKQCMQHA